MPQQPRRRISPLPGHAAVGGLGERSPVALGVVRADSQERARRVWSATWGARCTDLLVLRDGR
ncbi:hypothetical protein BJ965_005289 [Streptomyces luteogriseus]|uniref:Uncharacterized protein n=1 Tax=Streptomyces luteogriseus TaxID=68233 RepID=A0A7W7DU23_9ACTN|nr:hypothetical protein [Streptomyces luteogriseus]MBB4715407.1 hypothetical protein [Streptomyces luteogriseus]